MPSTRRDRQGNSVKRKVKTKRAVPVRPNIRLRRQEYLEWAHRSVDQVDDYRQDRSIGSLFTATDQRGRTVRKVTVEMSDGHRIMFTRG